MTRTTTNVDLILTYAERGHPTVIFETSCDGVAERAVLRRLARDLTGVVPGPYPKRGAGLRTPLYGGSRLVEGAALCGFSAATLYIRDNHLHTDVSLDLVPVIETALALNPGERRTMSITTLLTGEPAAVTKATVTTRDLLLEQEREWVESVLSATSGSQADRTARIRLAEVRREIMAGGAR